MTSCQRTIGRKVVFSGKALQSGRKAVLRCFPAGTGSGVIFKRADLAGAPEIRISGAFLPGGRKRRSSAGSGRVRVETIEHFMAALWALGIDNILAELEGPELPAMDGSAMGFLAPMKEAGTESQAEPREYIKILEPIEVREKDRSVRVEPSDSFSVSYLIDYRAGCIKNGRMELEFGGGVFEKEIAPARTFCLKREALFLFLSGMGRGANFSNTLVLGNKGPVGTSFRFPDEPLRHKILDLVGDLYMLGRPLLGRVSAERSGHRLNSMLVRKIYERYIK